jgi:hypothetical protein
MGHRDKPGGDEYLLSSPPNALRKFRKLPTWLGPAQPEALKGSYVTARFRTGDQIVFAPLRSRA